MRTIALLAILGGFSLLAVLDLTHGRYVTGSASAMLAAVNYLLLVAAR